MGDDMRRLMNLSPLQKVTKKYLRATITMREYEIAGKGYGEKWRVLMEGDVPTYEPLSQVGDATVIQQKNGGFPGPADITGEIALGEGLNMLTIANTTVTREHVWTASRRPHDVR